MTQPGFADIENSQIPDSAKRALGDTVNRKSEMVFREDGKALAARVEDLYSEPFQLSRSESFVAAGTGITIGTAAGLATYYAEGLVLYAMGSQAEAYWNSPVPGAKGALIFSGVVAALAVAFTGPEGAVENIGKAIASGVKVGKGVGGLAMAGTALAIESVKRKSSMKAWMSSESLLSDKGLEQRDLRDARRMETEGWLKDRLIQLKNYLKPQKTS